MNTPDLVVLCKRAIWKAHETLDSLKDGTTEVHDEHVTDISTKGDMAVSNALIKFFKNEKIPAVLYSEESGRIELTKNPRYTITFDDIDGTDNYFRGRWMLPYCTVITIFDSINPKFEDALVAGVLVHNSAWTNLWYAIRDDGCYQGNIGFYASFKKVKTSGRKVLDRRTLVAIDHYGAGKNVSKFLNIYPEAWVKDFGSAAFHLAGISNGLFDAFINLSQKAHELGAGYLLIKEASGYLVDLNGKSLDKVRHDFDAKYQIVTASTKELGETLLKKLK